MNILEQIAAETRENLARTIQEMPIVELERKIAARPAPLDFAAALRGKTVRIIAEIKRASPSRGPIRPDCDAAATALIYARNGAAAISVLTEPRHFKGCLDDLVKAKEAIEGYTIPLLRKDFILEPYQIYQARACGADCVLLIVALLSPTRLKELIEVSSKLGMSCLIEVHNEPELSTALEADAGIVGINNRDLRTFRVDPAVSERLAPLIPDSTIKVSESGITTIADIERMQTLGIDAVLIGEALISSPDIASRLKEMV